MSLVLVTGATATTGSRAADLLAGRGVDSPETRKTTTTGQLRLDWADQETW